eukprot:3865875-Amphidinium_carterae.1
MGKFSLMSSFVTVSEPSAAKATSVGAKTVKLLPDSASPKPAATTAAAKVDSMLVPLTVCT